MIAVNSIDNVSEIDGLMLLSTFLNQLNQEPIGPTKRRLMAIVPEYRADGQLDRLDVCTVPWFGPGWMDKAELRLFLAADTFALQVQQKRRDAPKPKPPKVTG